MEVLPPHPGRLQTLCFYLTELLAVATLVLVCKWVTYLRKEDGLVYVWDTAHVFNYHPPLMVGGLVFCYSQAMMTYQHLPFAKRVTKAAHVGLQTAGLVCVLVGLVAVFKFHNDSGIPNLYSLHSWMGLAVVLCFCLQYVMGVYHFLLPEGLTAVTKEGKRQYLSHHAIFGIALLFLAIGTCWLGLLEKTAFMGKIVPNADKYPEQPLHLDPQYYDANVLSAVMLALGVVATIAISRPRQLDSKNERLISDDGARDVTELGS